VRFKREVWSYELDDCLRESGGVVRDYNGEDQGGDNVGEIKEVAN